MEASYTRTNWTTEELAQLSGTLRDGLSLHTLEELLPRRTPKAISRKALEYNYSSKTINGSIVMKEGVNRRERTNQTIDNAIPIETTINRVDEPRVTTNNFTPTLSESLDNLPDESIAEVALEPINGLEANNLAR